MSIQYPEIGTDWGDILNNDIAELDARITDNYNKIGDISGLEYSNLADNVKKNTSALLDIMNQTILLDRYDDNIGIGGDDTVALQQIIDTCQPNAEIVFSKSKTYKISHLVIQKTLTINLNGCTIIASPMASGTGKAMFYFKGSRTHVGSVGNLTKDGSTITFANSIDGLPDVTISDSTIVQGWDYGATVPYSSARNGNGEINSISSNNGSVIVLNKPFEFDYTSASLYTINYINSPKVIGNGATIQEIDLGQFTGQVDENLPALVQMDYCNNAIVDDINVYGWNYKVVAWLYCKNPTAMKIVAKNPFRATTSAHGYVMQFVRCLNSLAKKNIGYGARHVVDYSNSIDGFSEYNIGYSGYTAQYMTHGYGSKRITSFSDMSINSGMGWSFGNGTFSADYDMTIINPILVSNNPSSEGIMASSKSENLKIIDCNINTVGKAISLNSGCKNIEIKGGTIKGNNSNSLFVRGTLSASDNVAGGEKLDLKPTNLIVKGLKIIGKVNVTVFVDGDFIFKDNELYNTYYVSDSDFTDWQFYLVSGTLSNFIFTDNYIHGNSKSGAKADILPANIYNVSRNNMSVYYTGSGGTGNQIYFPSNSSMIWCNNRLSASSYIFYGGISQTNLNSATISSNVPTTFDVNKSRTLSLTNNATTINASGYSFLALAYTVITTITSITSTNTRYDSILRIYSYNDKATISGSASGFRFATTGDVVFPSTGGMITFIYYADEFIEQSRTF